MRFLINDAALLFNFTIALYYHTHCLILLILVEVLSRVSFMFRPQFIVLLDRWLFDNLGLFHIFIYVPIFSLLMLPHHLIICLLILIHRKSATNSLNFFRFLRRKIFKLTVRRLWTPKKAFLFSPQWFQI